MSELHGRFRFSYCLAPATRFSGHKSTQLRNKERHTAGLPYARQIYIDAYAFLFVQLQVPSSSGGKPLWLCGWKHAAPPDHLTPVRAEQAFSLFRVVTFL